MKEEGNQHTQNGGQPRIRPISVSIMVVLVLFFTAINVIKVITALNSLDFLIVLVPEIPLYYLAVSGATWGIIGLILTFVLFFGRKSSMTLARIAFILYPITYWLEKLLIAERYLIQHRWQFELMITILFIAILFWLLERRQTKGFLIQ